MVSNGISRIFDVKGHSNAHISLGDNLVTIFQGSFVDIVEDFQCRRVEKIELMVSKHGSDEWFIQNAFESIQELDMTVTGTVDEI